MKDLVNSIVLGTFARHVCTLELVLPFGIHIPAVWPQGPVVVVFGTSAKQLQGVRDIPFHDFLTRGPVVQNSNIVAQCPAGTARSSSGSLAEITKLGMGSDLYEDRQGEKSSLE